MNNSKISKYLLFFVPLLVGWAFDYLLFDKGFGINFPIFIALLLAGGFGLASYRSAKPDPRSLILILPVLVFSIFPVFRLDGFTIFIDLLLTLVALVFLIITFRGGRWASYSVSDIVEKVFQYAFFVVSKPFEMLAAQTKTPTENEVKKDGKVLGAIFRGVLIALPIILVLASLLISADAVFEQNMKDLFSFLNWDTFVEFMLRAVLVLFLSLFIAVTYIFAHERSDDSELRGLEVPGLPSFVGQIETTVVLSLVNFLFLLFVIVQFQYLFGGQANISIDGYTYSEYARKGFGEMSMVAVLGLLLLQAAHSLTRVDRPKLKLAQTTLGVTMVAQLMVILFSAFQRLTLYEAAYGFSQTRTYTHVFMVWLALLLVSVVVLELKQRSRLFPTAVLIAAFGFGLTLNILNVDASIVRWNIERAKNNGELDIAYLSDLSLNAIPPLVSEFRSAEIGQQKDRAAAALLCFSYAMLNSENEGSNWQSISVAESAGSKALAGVLPEIGAYLKQTNEIGGTTYTINGYPYDCFTPYID